MAPGDAAVMGCLAAALRWRALRRWLRRRRRACV
jgi:hypothetical protein